MPVPTPEKKNLTSLSDDTFDGCEGYAFVRMTPNEISAALS
jgi:hypothetical protein